MIRLFLILAILGWRADCDVSEKRFKNFLKEDPKIIFYTVSAGMPLSVKGIPLIRSVAKEKGYRLIVLNDPLLPLLNAQGSPRFPLIQKNEFFIDKGFFHHFPSTLLAEEGRICGLAVPGYKTKIAFKKIVEDLHISCGNQFIREAVSPLKKPNRSSGFLVRETILPRPIRYFYKPINDDWVSYHTGENTYLFNRLTGQEFPFQGKVDSIPTPDGKYLTLPYDLKFFSIAEILHHPEEAATLDPILVDSTMKDSYQSIGILKEGFYRVLTSWTLSIAIRSYSERESLLIPGDPKQNPCTKLKLATPIISKDGTKAGAYVFGSGSTNTTQVLNLGIDGRSCDPILNLGERTSKIDFSPDNTRIAYMAKDTDSSNLGPFVREISSDRIWKIADLSSKEALTFPAYLPNGNILLMRIRKVDSSLQYFLQEYFLNEKESASL